MAIQVLSNVDGGYGGGEVCQISLKRALRRCMVQCY